MTLMDSSRLLIRPQIKFGLLIANKLIFFHLSGADVQGIEYRGPGMLAPMRMDRFHPSLPNLPPVDGEPILFVKKTSTNYK
jgi:hypothetical protein